MQSCRNGWSELSQAVKFLERHSLTCFRSCHWSLLLLWRSLSFWFCFVLTYAWDTTTRSQHLHFRVRNFEFTFHFTLVYPFTIVIHYHFDDHWELCQFKSICCTLCESQLFTLSLESWNCNLWIISELTTLARYIKDRSFLSSSKTWFLVGLRAAAAARNYTVGNRFISLGRPYVDRSPQQSSRRPSPKEGHSESDSSCAAVQGRQSPIAIYDEDAFEVTLPAWNFVDFRDSKDTISVENTGETGGRKELSVDFRSCTTLFIYTPNPTF